MKIIVGIGHPAHVHFYRNAIMELEKQGNEVQVFTKRRPLAIKLLNIFNIEYEVVGRSKIQHNSLLKTGLSFSSFELDMLKKVRNHQPSVVTGIGNIPLSHASTIFDCESFIFTDTEQAELGNKIAFPFADRIYTPDCYVDDIGDKQIRYPGYHELAYLHSNHFEPNPNVLNNIGIEKDNKIVILRSIDWNAVHDIGDDGLDDLPGIVESIQETGAKVLITAEGDIPDEIAQHKLNIAPHQIHDLMFYADLFIGESATMATESAVLGTPAIFISSSRRGYTDELEEEYGLVYNFSGKHRQQRALNRAISILDDYEDFRWKERREQLLEDKIDMTSFITNQISSTG